MEELRSVFDPRGGYWNKGKYVPSLIAEIGNVIEQHLVNIGMLKRAGWMSISKSLAQKQAELAAEVPGDDEVGSFPPNATLCFKCHSKAVIQKDGCMTCLNCGDSKCG